MTSLAIARRRVLRRTPLGAQAVLQALLCLLLLSACADRSPPPSARDPADPAARVPAVQYDPVLRGYVSRRPADPTQWGSGAPK